MVVPTFGVTYTGSYEPVKPLSDALDQLQADTGLDIDIHVDGASGAFLAPFCAPDIEWDFRVPRVKSISTSGHKFGLAPLGVGWVVWRDVAELPDDLIFHVTYLGGDMPVFQINFSRPAGQIVAQYYDFLRLGREGYRRVHEAAYATGQYLAERDRRSSGPFELLCDSNPQTGIPTVTWKMRRRRRPRLHAVRPGRPAAHPRLAGAGLPAHRHRVRHPGAAHPGAPGRQPRPGPHPARRLPRRGGPLRQAPGHRADDQGGVERRSATSDGRTSVPNGGRSDVTSRIQVVGPGRADWQVASCSWSAPPASPSDPSRGTPTRSAPCRWRHLLRRVDLLHQRGAPAGPVVRRR